jgi:hypothetical protein
VGEGGRAEKKTFLKEAREYLFPSLMTVSELWG